MTNGKSAELGASEGMGGRRGTPRGLVLIDPSSERRREVARRLAALGREVVPVLDLEQGRRYARELGGAFAVAVADDLLSAAVPGSETGPRGPLFRSERGDPLATLPFPARGGAVTIARQLALDLLSLDLLSLDPEVLGAGLEADDAAGVLVADLANVALLGIVRSLALAQFSGRIAHASGGISMRLGEIVGASAGRARDAKAFGRLAAESGTIRVVPESIVEAPAIAKVDDLVMAALEERSVARPAADARVRVVVGPSYYESKFTVEERGMLAALQESRTVGALLDAFPRRGDGELLNHLGGLIRRGVVALEEPARVRVVTDSAADLPPDFANAHGLRIVPWTLGPGELLATYAALLETQDVVAIHAPPLSERARTAAADAQDLPLGLRAELDGIAIEVVDAGLTGPGLGLLALAGARLAAQGLSASAIAKQLLTWRDGLATFAAPSGLAVTAALSGAGVSGSPKVARRAVFDRKSSRPLLALSAGRFESLGEIRTGSPLPALVENANILVGTAERLMVAVAHSGSAAEAAALRDLAASTWPSAEILSTEIGPALGAQLGAGAVVLAVLPLG